MQSHAIPGARFVDPKVLMRVGNLELLARHVVEGFINGLHRAPFFGASIDFAEHRGYVAGLRHGVWRTGPYFAVYGEGGGKGTVAQWQQAMGIDWTDDRREIAEAIPPAYTQHIGAQLMAHLLRG